MKKVFIPLLSFLLVFTLLLSVTGTAVASPVPQPAYTADPVVTPISGDMDFTTEVISTGSLPGTIEYNQMPVPVGFPAGEAQYGGDGVLVTKMDYGNATACFTIATAAVNQGWGGKVGVWNGTKWVKLPTTITPQDESPNSLVCASITGNGTYAFIKYITDASLLPGKIVTDLPVCQDIAVNWESRGLGSNNSYDPYWVSLGNFNVSYPALPNAHIEYYIVGANVAVSGDLHASTLSNGSGSAVFSGYFWRYDGTPLTNLFFTIRVVTPVCYDDFYYDWTWGLPAPPEA